MTLINMFPLLPKHTHIHTHTNLLHWAYFIRQDKKQDQRDTFCRHIWHLVVGVEGAHMHTHRLYLTPPRIAAVVESKKTGRQTEPLIAR